MIPGPQNNHYCSVLNLFDSSSQKNTLANQREESCNHQAETVPVNTEGFLQYIIALRSL